MNDQAYNDVRHLRVILWIAGAWVLFVVLLVAGVRRACGETRDNVYDARVEKLGQQLFHDPRTSINNSVACATCHVPARFWTDNRQTAVGVGDRVGPRNTPTCVNVEDKVTRRFFYDGVSYELEGQVFRPTQNILEHGFTRAEDMIAKLNRIPGYQQQSMKIWGQPLTLQTFSNAIATYMRSIKMDDSPEHQFRRGDRTALTASQKAGRKLFETKGCSQCHNGENLRDGGFHNTGAELALGRGTDLGVGNIDRRQGFQPRDRAFKTQSLWNLVDTAPYFHHGRAATIDDVLDHYNRGGANLQGQVDPLIDRRVLAMRGTLSDPAEREALKDWLVNGCRGTIPKDPAPELP